MPDAAPLTVAPGASEQELDEKFPNRPRNHSPTLPFHDLFLRLFNPLIEHRGFKRQSHDARAAIIQSFITRWRERVGPDIYPAFRLILPSQDRDRPMYGLKEKAIARLLVKAMRIDPKSTDAQNMLNWKLPGYGSVRAMAGDFAGRCHEVLSKRPRRVDVGNMSIGEVNDLLDQLSLQQREGGQLSIFEQFFARMNPDELLWLIRIILRQMKIGATEKTIFHVWHNDAESLYSVTSSLRRVCWELHDKARVLDKDEAQIELMQCFVPQLAQYQRPFDTMIAGLGCTSEEPTFWIEEKLDGERMQLHMESDDSVPGGKRFRFWSRKGKDYTYLYGESMYDTNAALTCHLKEAFEPDIENIILDGEMITWDPDQDAMVPFGTLKTAALAEKEAPGINTGPRPLYRVFDCLYVNNTPIAGKPLSFRYDALKESVPRPPHRRLEILEHQEADKVEVIGELLRRVVAEASEGLVLKNPRSPYEPNSRNNDWWKVKPDYLEEFGENLDCVVIGGYYGSGRRGNILSSYLCGLRLDNVEPIHCYSFFKVGGGFARSDYQAIRRQTEGKWQAWDPKKPPKCIELAGGKAQVERPDLWIRPEDSVVLAVKAASVMMTNDYATNFTLRFPRFKSLRLEKGPQQALSFSEFRKLREDVEKEHAHKELEAAKSRKKRTPSAPRKKPLTVMGNEAPVTDYEGQATGVFESLAVYVMSDAVHPKKQTKAAVEQMVKANGGRVIQTHDAVPGTICVADKNLVKVAGLRKKGGVDIVRPKWLYDCVAQAAADGPDRPRFRVPLEPQHMFVATPASEPWIAENVDAYGDAYARDVGPDEVREIIENMELPKGSVDAAAFRADLAERGLVIEGEPKAEMFQGLVLHFAPSHPSTAPPTGGDTTMSEAANDDTPVGTDDPLLRMVRATATFAGATLASKLEAGVGITHVIVGALGLGAAPETAGTDDRARRRETARTVRAEIAEWSEGLPRVVTVEWVERCWAEGTQLDEEAFAVL